MNELSTLRAPNVDALVEAARGEEAAIGTEGHRVDGLRVLRQRVQTVALLHLPETNCRVE